MSGKREYDIAFVGLKPGIHEFIYEVKDKFFTEYGPQDFDNCNSTVKLTLDKSAGLMLLKFEIGGSLDVICDRCGNNLPLQLWDEFKVVVKLVDNAAVMNEREEDPDVFYLDRNESHLNVGDWIYEFVNLSIPTTHFCGGAESDGSQCNEAALAKLKALHPEDGNANTIWKGLEKFKSNNNNKNQPR